MAQLDRETLKEFFEAGDFPTEAQFADFIDSVLNFIDDGNVVFLTGNQTIAGEKTFSNNLKVNAQANGGDNLKTFSASATFDANDGNNQKMITTANTTIALSNELPGTYILKLLISGTVTAITVGASIGTKLPNASLDFDYTDGAVNLVTIIVDADGVKDYTITN